jgi:hypothetical protein
MMWNDALGYHWRPLYLSAIGGVKDSRMTKSVRDYD